MYTKFGATMVKAVDGAYETIRAGILDGRWAPGAPLREEELAAALGVSRTPVREALRRLAADGYVEFPPNGRATVTSWTPDSLADLVDVRAELAALAARKAAQRLGPAELDRLRAINRAMAKLAGQPDARSLRELARLNLAFHAIVFEGSGSEWLPQLLRQTVTLLLVQRAHQGFRRDDWKRSVAHYDELIDAVAARDGEWAASIIRAHFLAAKHTLLATLRAVRGDAAQAA